MDFRFADLNPYVPARRRAVTPYEELALWSARQALLELCVQTPPKPVWNGGEGFEDAEAAIDEVA